MNVPNHRLKSSDFPIANIKSHSFCYKTRVVTCRCIAVMQCSQSGRLSSASRGEPASQLAVPHIPRGRQPLAKTDHHTASDSRCAWAGRDIRESHLPRGVTYVHSPGCMHMVACLHSYPLAPYTCRGTQIFRPMGATRNVMQQPCPWTAVANPATPDFPSDKVFACGSVGTARPALHSIVRFELCRWVGRSMCSRTMSRLGTGMELRQCQPAIAGCVGAKAGTRDQHLGYASSERPSVNACKPSCCTAGYAA